jgi:DNA-binding NtrC family response regulator
VAAGRFQQDLYFRLSVFLLETPTLRSRPEDIPLLAEHLLRQASIRNHCPLPRLTQANLQDLAAYSWPGNIRELQNVIERAVIVSRGGPMRFALRLLQNLTASGRPPTAAGATQRQWMESQRESILEALEKCGGKIHGRNGAAALLGLAPSTLSSRIAALGIVRRRAVLTGDT